MAERVNFVVERPAGANHDESKNRLFKANALVLIIIVVCLVSIAAHCLSLKYHKEKRNSMAPTTTQAEKPLTATTVVATKAIPSTAAVGTEIPYAHRLTHIFGHFALVATQSKTVDGRLQFDINPKFSWTSHDIALKDNGTKIVFGRRGVYEVKLTLCFQCHKSSKYEKYYVKFFVNCDGACGYPEKQLIFKEGFTRSSSFFIRVLPEYSLTIKLVSPRKRPYSFNVLENSLDIKSVRHIIER